eukprot:TRINITY_DN6072_c0_g1_i1.p1 TRINITY_DN6072_c0_g1~~TRINITY_DN6072_c0_g1_i1.p1  ORF type:complete len:699 (+),score=188.88 TRINITY_DN6072_c0_g1_i1:135-2231(+)
MQQPLAETHDVHERGAAVEAKSAQRSAPPHEMNEFEEAQILAMLELPSVAQKIGGLTLVASYCKARNSRYPAGFVARVYEAVGEAFLDNLLHSPDAAHNDVAVNVLSVFCTVPELAALPAMVARISSLLAILQRSELQTPIAADTVNCALTLAASSAEAAHETFSSGLLRVISEYLCTVPDVDETWLTRLHGVLQAMPPPPEAVAEAAARPAALFAAAQDKQKFACLAVLDALLDSCSCACPFPEPGASAELFRGLQFDVRLGLACILFSRLGEQERCGALSLANSMICLCGISWAYCPWPALEAPQLGNSGLSAHKFFSLLTSLSTVEVRVLLRTTTASSVTKMKTLAACFSILDHVMDLVFSSEDDSGVAQDVGSAFAAQAVDQLSLVNADVQNFLLECKETNNTENAAIVFALHFLGTWLAVCEESIDTSLNPELVPYVVNVAIARPETFHLVLQGMPALTEKEDTRTVFLFQCAGLTLLADFICECASQIVSSLQGSAESTPMLMQSLEAQISSALTALCNVLVLEQRALADFATPLGRVLSALSRCITANGAETGSEMLFLHMAVTALLVVHRNRTSGAAADADADAGAAADAASVAGVAVAVLERYLTDHGTQWQALAGLWLLGLQTLASCVRDGVAPVQQRVEAAGLCAQLRDMLGKGTLAAWAPPLDVNTVASLAHALTSPPAAVNTSSQ